jgi:hypothetical protein
MFSAKFIFSRIYVQKSSFDYMLFLNPVGLSGPDKRHIQTILGRANRLGYTKDAAKQSLDDDMYDAVIHIWNHDCPDDEAIATLQYTDHLEQGEPQLWVNDLSRLGTSDAISPVRALFSIFEGLAVSEQVNTLYLMVDKKPAESHAKLIHHYANTYGFSRYQDIQSLDVTVMKKDL